MEALPGPATATEPQGGIGLPDLPVGVLETICRALPMQDRMRLTACCRELWLRSDVAGSAALWGDLVAGQQLLGVESKRASLAAWLGRRKAGCRRLRLSVGSLGGSEAMALLQSLAGGQLDALEVSMASAWTPDCVEAAFVPLQGLPCLTRLELRGGLLGALPSHLTALPSLAALDVSRNARLGAGGAPRLAGGAGAGGGGGSTSLEEVEEQRRLARAFQPLADLARFSCLTFLDLSSCGLPALPPPLSALGCTLRELDLNTNALRQEPHAKALAPLRHLAALTALNLRWCGLAAPPAELSALRSLAVLDMSRNSLLFSGGEGVLAPLLRLPGLTRLDLSFCGLASLAPLSALTLLADLSLTGNLELGEAGGEGGLRPLGALRALSRVELSRCNLPASEFGWLAAMSQAGVHVRF